MGSAGFESVCVGKAVDDFGWTGFCAEQNVDASNRAIPAVYKRGVMGHLRQRCQNYTSAGT